MKKIPELEEQLKMLKNNVDFDYCSFLQDYETSVKRGYKWLSLYEQFPFPNEIPALSCEFLRYNIKKFSISVDSSLLKSLYEFEQNGFRVCGTVKIPHPFEELATRRINDIPAVVLKYVGKKEL